MTTQHTPGPWAFDGQSVLDSKGQNACTKANGPLIASAPELLSALEGLLALRCIEAVENIHGDKAVAIKTARAAIQRAKGGK